MTLFRCSHCGEQKSAESFAPSQRKNSAWCRACFRSDYLAKREQKLAYQRARVPAPRVVGCAWCGVEFTTPYQRTKYCNRSCKNAAQHGTRPAVNGGAMARITRGRLARRDGWICALCGDPIDPKARRPDLMSASVDHRHPKSLGGSDDLDNLQLAHLRCNILKSNKVMINGS